MSASTAWISLPSSSTAATTPTKERLESLDDVYKLYRCRTIMNCTEVCPKKLSPARVIERIKVALLRKSV